MVTRRVDRPEKTCEKCHTSYLARKRQRVCSGCSENHTTRQLLVEHRPFVAVESVPPRDGQPGYVAVHNGSTYERLELADEDELWRVVFPWLHPRVSGDRVACVALNVDAFTAGWLHGLRANRLRKLYHKDGKWERRPKGEYAWPLLPVDLDDNTWQVRADVHGRFQFGHDGKWVTLCDLESLLPDDLDLPADTERRLAELVRIAARVDGVLRSIGVRLAADWFGRAGSAAAALLRAHQAPDSAQVLEAIPNRAVWRLARRAWMAGWYEIMQHGPIPGATFDYDINSAYPLQIRDLPCLLHGRWRHTPGLIDLRPGGIQLVEGEARGSDPHIGVLGHRVTGTGEDHLIRPHVTRGVWHRQEIDASRRCGTLDDLNVEDVWTYTPPKRCPEGCTPKPFRWMQDVYDLRAKLKADGDTLGAGVLKLVMNSVNGKFCQQVGGARYLNWLYVGRVTAGTTARILDAIATHPGGTRSVIEVACDGVHFDSPHPYLITDTGLLGDWKMVEHDNPVMHRVHWGWDRSGWLKSSGIPPELAPQLVGELDWLWRQASDRRTWGVVPSATVRVPLTTTGMGAAHSRQYRRIGQTKEHPLTVSGALSLGRVDPRWDGDRFRTSPLDKPERLESSDVLPVGEVADRMSRTLGGAGRLSKTEMTLWYLPSC
jgi:hypothetical protein